jgi:conjugal transfer ATP-binding protein TraC
MGIQQNKLKEGIKREPLSDWLPYIAYEDGLYLLMDGSLGFIFEINPLLEAGSDTHKIISRLYNSEFFPTNSTIQWHVFASERIFPQLETWKMSRSAHFKRFSEERAKLYTENIKDILGHPVRDFRFLVSIKIPHPLKKKGFLHEEDIDLSYWDGYTEEVNKIRESVQGILESAFLLPRDFPPESLIPLLVELFNPEHPEDSLSWNRYQRNEEIRHQIIDYETKIRITERGIFLNHYELKSLSPRIYPEVWDMYSFHELFGDSIQSMRQIPSYFLLSANFIMLDKNKSKSALTAKASIVKHQSFGFITHFIPRLRRKAENFDIIMQEFENGETAIKGYLNLFVRGKTPKETEKLKEVAGGIWRAKNFEIQEDPYIMLPLLLQSLPLGLEPSQDKLIKRAKTIPSSAGAALTPVAMDWKGSRGGPLIFISRRGQIMQVDFFKSSSNYNCVMFAQSGSGKSFLTSDIISGYLAEGAQVFVVDIGRSYEKLCKYIGGDFIVFSEDSNISLNPFSNVASIKEDMELLKPLLCQMASPSKALTDLEKSYVEKAINESWNEKGQDAEIDDVVRTLEAMEDPYHRAKDLARMLYPFSEHGQYGRFFTGKASISFGNSLTLIELEELKGKPELQSAVLLLIIYHISRAMYLGERGRKKLAVIDEAWDLLGGKMAGEFISHGYRRARKYGGSFISITQSLLDFYRVGSVGEAITENSAWMLMLRQKGESLEEIKKGRKLMLSSYFLNLVESLTTVPGRYSEVFIYNSERGMGLGRFVVDRFSYWLYTTKPDEVALLNRLIRDGLRLEEAIGKCIEVTTDERQRK